MARSRYRAPAVRYPFGRSPVVAWVLLGVAVLGLADMLAWCFTGAGGVARGLTGIVLWVLCVLAAWRWWHAQRAGQLLWNGSEWLLRTDNAFSSSGECVLRQRPRVHLDVSTGVLVSVCVLGSWWNGRTVWLWLECSREPRCWHALRCALFARTA